MPEEKKNEKGFVLILSLVTMVAMTLIGLSLIMNMSTDMQLSRNEREAKIAFQLAQAGINEAAARLHLPDANSRYIGEDTTDYDTNPDYRALTWGNNFSFNSSIIGNLGSNQNYQVTISYLDESNPENFCDDNDTSIGAGNYDKGMNVAYSTPPFTCDKSPSEIVFYGKDFNILSTKVSRGLLPVYRIVSTGTVENTSRKIEAYVGGSSLNTDSGTALNSNGCITNNGGAVVATTCLTTGCGGADCDTVKAATDPTTNMNEYLGDTLANIAAQADLKLSCDSPSTCNAVLNSTTDADWGDYSGNTYSTIIYINNSSEVNITGNDLGPDSGGRGILIVSGDLKLSGNFRWEGLVYVMGTLTLDGGGSGVNITGGVLANSVTTLNGASLTLNYDLETLKAVARESSSAAMLVWKRM